MLILAGIWLERWMLVAPALWKGKDIPLGVTEILITAGFLGLVVMCIQWFLSRFPVLPVRRSDLSGNHGQGGYKGMMESTRKRSDG